MVSVKYSLTMTNNWLTQASSEAIITGASAELIAAHKATLSEAIITGASAGLIFKLADAAARLGVSESTLK